MKIFFCIVLCFILNFTNSLYAGDLEDFEQLFKSLQENYTKVIEVGKHTRIYKVYYDDFENLKKLALKIQRKLTRTGVRDFEIDKMAEIYYRTFSEALNIEADENWSKQSKSKKLGNMNYAIKILNQNIKSLKEMKYPNIEWEDPKSDKFVYFEKSFNEVIQNYSKIFDSIKNARKGDKQYKNYSSRMRSIENSKFYTNFLNKLIELGYYARDIHIASGKLNRSVDLVKEVKIIRQAFRDAEEIIKEESEATERIKRIKKKRNNVKFTKKEHIRLVEMKFSVDLVRKQINYLKSNKFTLIDKLKSKIIYAENSRPDTNQNTSNSNEKVELEEVSNFEAYSNKQLFDLLQKIRDEILRSSIAIVGLDENTVKRYEVTLTSEQKKMFNTIKKKYKERGYDKQRIESSSTLEVHGKIKNISKYYNRTSIIKLLEKIQKYNAKKGR